jgi:hypothetical protein
MNWSDIGPKVKNTAWTRGTSQKTSTTSQTSTNVAASTNRASIKAEQECGEAIVQDHIPRAAEHRVTGNKAKPTPQNQDKAHKQSTLGLGRSLSTMNYREFGWSQTQSK